MTSSKTVLVTGASSGIGRSIATHLTREGYHVFGTSRQPHADADTGFEILPLDVTNGHSVIACVATVLERAGQLDVLVNNAGVDLVGAVEETALADAQWIFDTNFFGVVRMVQAVLPHMRVRRSGQIINISSALGRAGWPFEALYCASKYALEGYTESLRYEMAMFGIKVSSVQPGFFRSNIFNSQRYPQSPVAEYDAPRARAIQLGKKWNETAPDPLPVARKVQQIIESRSPRLRYPVGLEAIFAPPLAHLLPEGILLWLGRRMLGVKKPSKTPSQVV
jgi:NAD(P)-dependent dehydrogenase (short-subunit alcohol dehydrogenase family)